MQPSIHNIYSPSICEEEFSHSEDSSELSPERPLENNTYEVRRLISESKYQVY